MLWKKLLRVRDNVLVLMVAAMLSLVRYLRVGLWLFAATVIVSHIVVPDSTEAQYVEGSARILICKLLEKLPTTVRLSNSD